MSRRETLNAPKGRWDLTDGCILLGVVMAIAGLALISVPVAVIVAGLALAVLGIFSGQGDRR